MTEGASSSSPWIAGGAIVTITATHLEPGTVYHAVFVGYRSDDDPSPAYASFTPPPAPQSGVLRFSFSIPVLSGYFPGGEPGVIYKIRAYLFTGGYENFNTPALDSEGRPYELELELFEYTPPA